MTNILKQYLLAVLCLWPAAAIAQNGTDGEFNTQWHDGTEFPVFGKATDMTLSPYDRLPAACENKIRKRLWNLGRNTAGLYIRFRSDSPYIRLRWTSRFGVKMNHMTDTGVRGLDLYWLTDEGVWRFARNGRPSKEMETEATVISNMGKKPREWMLYLPLYDGLKALEIGVDADSYIGLPKVDSPASGNPVVMYGTSILQGGCVSRPGALATSVIGRKLDREVINLGFSGSAHLDREIAVLMAQTENPAVFILDYVANSSPEMIRESGMDFFRIIRDAHPSVPVIFCERETPSHAALDSLAAAGTKARNLAQRELYESLRKKGEKRIWYIGTEAISGSDGEGTVDGTHSNDIGAMRYVDAVLPVIRKAMKRR